MLESPLRARLGFHGQPRANSGGVGVRLRRTVVCLVVAAHVSCACPTAHADEGGVSFWLPGNFGSFAATPSDPGWSCPLLLYPSIGHQEAGKQTVLGGRIAAGMRSSCGLLFLTPTLTFAKPWWGAQASAALGLGFGYATVEVDVVASPPGGAGLDVGTSDERVGITDLNPTLTLKWARGVHNTMLYTMGGQPAGTYDASRLANLGSGHWSLDAGGGYTFLDPRKGLEASAALGFTFNGENSSTDYQSGVSTHLDWAASRVASERFHIGVVGYVYEQVTPDSGPGATLGDYQSRVLGIGPQAGWFPGEWYVNLKGYWEFAAQNRPQGWNLWLTVEPPTMGRR
jgi:hypothetical protein